MYRRSRQAFAGTIVDDTQNAETPAAGHLVRGNVERPAHIGGHRQDHMGACPERPVAAGFYQLLEEIQGGHVSQSPAKPEISATPTRFRIAGGN